jgi:hypothetical protein
MSAERKQPEALDDDEAPRGNEEESELDRKLAQWARFGLPIATIAGAMIAGKIQGPPAAVLVLTGGTLIGVIALLWASVRTLVGETPLSGADAYALGAPRAEEEQKRAVLRALKDLEFEHGVGKISDEDYRELVTKYRAEAKRLLRQIDADAEPRRAQIEALVNARLRKEGLLEGALDEEHESEPKGPLEDEDDADASAEASAEASAKSASAKGDGAKAKGHDKKRKKGKGRAEPASASGAGASKENATSEDEAGEETRVCPACETVNDADAVFCKKCGKRQEKGQSAVAAASPDETRDSSATSEEAS